VLDGELSTRVMFDVFRGEIKKDDITAMFKRLDNTVVNVYEKAYTCVPGSHSEPRHLEEVNCEEEESY